jgi:hypothetical protein
MKCISVYSKLPYIYVSVKISSCFDLSGIIVSLCFWHELQHLHKCKGSIMVLHEWHIHEVFHYVFYMNSNWYLNSLIDKFKGYSIQIITNLYVYADNTGTYELKDTVASQVATYGQQLDREMAGYVLEDTRLSTLQRKLSKVRASGESF